MESSIVSVARTRADLPANVFSFPETVLQFGTGVLLRGLPDYYIDKANKLGAYAGRVVVVKSTGGSTGAFARQDNLYTHRIRGVEHGEPVDRTIINASIARVIDAQTAWPDILDVAGSAALKLIVSNTTEVGIRLDPDDRIDALPPVSFPGKLLACLYARYHAFRGLRSAGLTIVPTELLVDNGRKLKEIVLDLARINRLEPAVIDWIATANEWCSSLVDRIVPGALSDEDQAQLERENGYRDPLAIMSEPYGLWAIETAGTASKDALAFAAADPGVVIAPDITKHRELKLRLLNATHTFCCGLAFFREFPTVYDAMKDASFRLFLEELMFEEIIPSITGDIIPEADARDFAGRVIDRFANPFIHHQWLSITLQYTGKMRQRCMPLLREYYRRRHSVPARMARGIAGWLAFTRPTGREGDGWLGLLHGKTYPIRDEEAGRMHAIWQAGGPEAVVHAALGQQDLWQTDLNDLAGLPDAVASYLREIVGHSAKPPVAS